MREGMALCCPGTHQGETGTSQAEKAPAMRAEARDMAGTPRPTHDVSRLAGSCQRHAVEAEETRDADTGKDKDATEPE